MASPSDLSALSERADVHKSCKSLEVLLSVLNDYCEAAGAIIIMQKKLAKALRETAGMKTTGEIAANAMNASAAIFEALFDTNAKFAKIADKEYDSLSAEVKKWFKKLAKEEKAHDERMSNANARIKQAGQLYEKKAKKNPHDTLEEHARYINIISTLGPEISRDKYNHALLVTQRHVSTTYTAASCLSRIAEAEWLRICENVRKLSPTIGQLGEWRVLCEGGWQGPIPQDLPNLAESQQPQPDRDATREWRPEDNHHASTTPQNSETMNSRESVEQSRLPVNLYAADTESPQDHLLQHRNQPTIQQANFLGTSINSMEHRIRTKPLVLEPPQPFANETNTDSVRSLSAFPLPPTHFPLPPPQQQQYSLSQSSHSSPTQASPPIMSQFTESPLSYSEDSGNRHSPAPPSLHDVSTIPVQPSLRQSVAKSDNATASMDVAEERESVRPSPERPLMSPSRTSDNNLDINPSTSPQGSVQPHPDDYNDHEFGVSFGHTSVVRVVGGEKQIFEGGDTVGSSGSRVAAMRNRFSKNSGTISPPLRDLPRLPLSVNDLASRYLSTDSPSSQRLRSPSIPRSSQQQPSSLEREVQSRQRQSLESHTASSGYIAKTSPKATSPREDEVTRRHQQLRMSDLAQLELKERELELIRREQELEMRTRELELDHTHPTNVRQKDKDDITIAGSPGLIIPRSYPQLRPRERKTSFQTPQPQYQLRLDNLSPLSNHNLGQQYSQHSYSTSQLVPPSPSANSRDGQLSHQSHYPNPSQSSQQSIQTSHPPYCACSTCSTANARMSPTAFKQNPAKPIEIRPTLLEKPKSSWIRRLSMPVGNAFSLESKRGVSNGIAGGQGQNEFFNFDGKKNASSTALRSRVLEDGRRSYESSGTSNRSMTNLEVGRR